MPFIKDDIECIYLKKKHSINDNIVKTKVDQYHSYIACYTLAR